MVLLTRRALLLAALARFSCRASGRPTTIVQQPGAGAGGTNWHQVRGPLGLQLWRSALVHSAGGAGDT